MAQATKSQQYRLMPSPKALQKALAHSADRARRMADAFGLKVPSVAGKKSGVPRKVAS